MPSRHLGASATALERRGIKTRIGDGNRAAARLNALAGQLEAEQAACVSLTEQAQRAAQEVRQYGVDLSRKASSVSRPAMPRPTPQRAAEAPQRAVSSPSLVERAGAGPGSLHGAVERREDDKEFADELRAAMETNKVKKCNAKTSILEAKTVFTEISQNLNARSGILNSLWTSISRKAKDESIVLQNEYNSAKSNLKTAISDYKLAIQEYRKAKIAYENCSYVKRQEEVLRQLVEKQKAERIARRRLVDDMSFTNAGAKFLKYILHSEKKFENAFDVPYDPYVHEWKLLRAKLYQLADHPKLFDEVQERFESWQAEQEQREKERRAETAQRQKRGMEDLQKQDPPPAPRPRMR